MEDETGQMIIAIAWNGSMIIKDQMGNKHLFTPWEANQIQTACYKFVQKKNEGVVMKC